MLSGVRPCVKGVVVDNLDAVHRLAWYLFTGGQPDVELLTPFERAMWESCQPGFIRLARQYLEYAFDTAITQ